MQAFLLANKQATGPWPEGLPIRTVLVVFILVVPLVLSGAPAAAQYRDTVTDSFTVESRTTSMIAPAVGERPDGSLVGVGMEMEATIRTGGGGVFLDTRPLTQLDMQGSARLAATMASSIAGADFSEHDFVIKVRSPTTAVGGPSAGGVMAVAFTALFLDLPVRHDVMMTGMINPDGSIGPVGGIVQKAEAAHNEGADLFLIPEGQGTVRHVETVEGEDEGPFQRPVTRERRIDVAEHAMEQWGLRVEEVSDVHEAFRWFTDHELERPEVPETTRSPVFDQVMGETADRELEDTQVRHARVRGELDGSGLQQQEPQMYTQLDEILDGAGDRLDLAQDAVDRGEPYTASSRAFQANVEIARVEVWVEILGDDDPADRLEAMVGSTRDRIDRAVTNASAASVGSLVVLEAVGAAQVRAAEAGRLVERAQEALDAGQVPSAVETLAFARERERSVAWWLSISGELAARVEEVPFEADLGELAREYRQVAREAQTYAEVLGGQVGGGEDQGRLLELARTSLRDSRTAQEAGLTVGSLYLAVEAQVAAHATLSLLGSEALIGDRLARQKDAALLAVEEARRLGLEPFLAASFREFAQALEDQDPVSALLLYGNAATIATISSALAGGETPIFGMGSGSSEPPLVTRVGGLGPDPWTGYFALATIVFGFMAGILVTLIVLQARSQRPSHGRPPILGRSRRGAAFPQGVLHPGAHGNGGGAHGNGNGNGNGYGIADRAPGRAVPRRAARPQPVLAIRRGPKGSLPERATPRGDLK